MDLDAADRTFLASMVPNGGVVTQFVAVAEWINPDGTISWDAYVRSDEPPWSTVGLLELAKHGYVTEALEDED